MLSHLQMNSDQIEKSKSTYSTLPLMDGEGIFDCKNNQLGSKHTLERFNECEDEEKNSTIFLYKKTNNTRDPVIQKHDSFLNNNTKKNCQENNQ